MNASQRAALLRRVNAAEETMAHRVMSRVAGIIQSEIEGMPVRRSHPIMAAIHRASQSGAAPRDAVGVLLKEIATVEPELAGRIGKAVGVEVPATAAVAQ